MKVVGRDFNSNKEGIYWMCECDCQKGVRVPKQRSIRQDKLLEGRTLSCGCLKLKQKTRGTRSTNTFEIDGDTCIGYTSKGEKFLFDLEDFDLIKSVSESWHFNDSGYVTARDIRETSEKYKNGRSKLVYMKDIVMHKQLGETVRYINFKDKNDNRKSNLKKGETK